MSDPKQEAKQLTRLPAKHLYFKSSEPVNVQGNHVATSLKCYPEPPMQPNYYTAAFLPAYQMFEITWHRRGTPPHIRLMPTTHIETWEQLTADDAALLFPKGE